MKGWNIQTTFQGYYNYFHYTYQERVLKVEQLSGRMNASNSFVFGKGWTAELTGWLRTPAVYALTKSPWLGSLDAGVQKSFGSKLKANLSAQDVFYSNRIRGNINVPEFRQQTRLAFDTRVVMLSFTYTFGNNQLKGIRQRKTGSEDETQRTN